MQTVELTTQLRNTLGKETSRKLRRQNLIPATVYGGGRSRHIAVPYFEFHRHYTRHRHANILYALDIPGEGRIQTLVKEVQIHPVTNRITHIDFYELTAGKKIRVRVGVRLVGTPAGVKEGGILEHFVWDLLVECLPEHLVETIDIDVSGLNIGDSLHVRDLKVPEHLRVLDDPDEIVVTIGVPTKEETPAAQQTETTPQAQQTQQPAGQNPTTQGQKDKKT